MRNVSFNTICYLWHNTFYDGYLPNICISCKSSCIYYYSLSMCCIVHYIHAEVKAHILVFVSFAGENTFDTCSSCRSHYTDAPRCRYHCTAHLQLFIHLIRVCKYSLLYVLPKVSYSLSLNSLVVMFWGFQTFDKGISQKIVFLFNYAIALQKVHEASSIKLFKEKVPRTLQVF